MVMVVGGSEDGRLLIWDLNTRQVRLDERVHEGALLGVGVHPTRPLVATSTLDRGDDSAAAPGVVVRLHEIVSQQQQE